MSMGRALGMFAAAAMASCALAACGGSGGGGATAATHTAGQLDPASKVPASAVAYVDITVRPQGSLETNLVNTVDKLAGPGAAQHAANGLLRSFGTHAQVKQVEAWLGPNAGLALTALPSGATVTPQLLEQHLVAVATTTDPAAAKKFLESQPKSSFGFGFGVAGTWKIVGHFVILGSVPAVNAVAATPTARSLASDTSYKSALGQLSGDQLATAYIRTHQLLQELAPLINRSSSASAEFTAALKKLPDSSTAAIGIGVSEDMFRFDTVRQGLPDNGGSSPSDVGSLPGSSWLALAVNISANTTKEIEAELPGLIAQAQSRAGGAGRSVQGFLPFLEQDLIPALGPMSLSVAGSSIGGMQAGVTLAPNDQAAGSRLFTALKRLLGGAPVLASKVGKQLTVSFGYADPKDLLSPSTHLADNPTYKAALAQLPSGSKVPFFLNFGPVASLSSSLDKSPSDASVLRVVKRLKYLIIGETHTRLSVVLAVK